MKPTTLFISGLMALSLSACSATTSGVVNSMAKQAAVNSATTAVAPSSSVVAVNTPELDANMDCAALTTQMAEVDGIILASNQTIAGSGSASLKDQALKTGASQGLARSGATKALSKVPFGGLFAKKAIDSVGNSSRKKVEQAQVDLQAATLRKASLSGLYAGKNCGS